MNRFGIKRLIATFDYDMVVLNGAHSMPRAFFFAMEEELYRLYDQDHNLERFCHIFESDVDMMIHAMYFGGNEVMHISWDKSWSVPMNFSCGRELIQKALNVPR